MVTEQGIFLVTQDLALFFMAVFHVSAFLSFPSPPASGGVFVLPTQGIRPCNGLSRILRMMG